MDNRYFLLREDSYSKSGQCLQDFYVRVTGCADDDDNTPYIRGVGYLDKGTVRYLDTFVPLLKGMSLKDSLSTRWDLGYKYQLISYKQVMNYTHNHGIELAVLDQCEVWVNLPNGF